MESILITGASGFIGSYIVEEALNRGMSVWAGVRSSSSRAYLQNPKIHFIELDFSHPNELRAQLSGYKGTYSKFDYIVHCAGITKSVRQSNFDYVNYLQTRYFVETLTKLNMLPKKFVYLSTLSVFGPIHEDDYSPIKASDVPKPNTAYGQSKLKAELFLQSVTDLPYIILRPTGVYGPREKDYFLMVKSIRSHADFSVGYKRQDLTFVYVKDVVKAVFLSIDKKVYRREYFLTDGNVYQSRTFSDLIRSELGNPLVLRIQSPLWFLRFISSLAEWWSEQTGKSSTLNTDKYKIMKQRNWRCDITPAREELDYVPDYQLERGVKEAVSWYKREGWI